MSNWLIDSGASAHMTHFITDLIPETIYEIDKIVEVADGTETHSKRAGTTIINMLDDNGRKVKGTMDRVM